MAELNKWQVREATAYAAEHSVTYDAAVGELFPPETSEAPAPAAEAEVPAEDTKVKVGAK